MSTKAHAKLVSVDPSEALRMRGIIDYVSLKDIPGSTTWGMIVPDEEEIFASEKVGIVLKVHINDALFCVS